MLLENYVSSNITGNHPDGKEFWPDKLYFFVFSITLTGGKMTREFTCLTSVACCHSTYI